MARRLPRLLLLVLTLNSACAGSSPGGPSTVAPVASVTVTGVTGALTVGQSLQLTAATADADGKALTGRSVTWSSSTPAVASVGAGLVVAIVPGTTTITATSEGQHGSVTVTVSAATPAAVSTVSITGISGAILPGQSVQLTATPRDAEGRVLTGRTITWNSTPAGLVTISTGGTATAVASGTATITATSEGRTGTVQLVINPAPVAQVSVSASKTAFVVGDAAVTYTATPKDAQGNALAGRAITWGVSAAGVVSVSASGAVTAIAPGSTTVTATSEGIVGSIPVTVTANNTASLLEQRVLAQQGLAIALASTVLQTQLYTLIVLNGADPFTCLALPGGGAMRSPVNTSVIPATMSFFFDTGCTRPYMVETVTQYTEEAGGNYHIVANALYTGPTGTPLGSIAFDERANNISLAGGKISGTVNGLGIYTSPGGTQTVQLGLNCDFTSPAHNIGICQGGIAQNFAALNTALGSVATLALDSSSTGVLSFTGGSQLRSGALNSLTLIQPGATSMVVTGGTSYGTATAGGAAANFSLFPPTPTGWSVTDAANDMVFTIGLTDNATRTLGATLKRVSSGATVATLALDQSGTGTITYSNGLVASVTSWMLGQ